MAASAWSEAKSNEVHAADRVDRDKQALTATKQALAAARAEREIQRMNVNERSAASNEVMSKYKVASRAYKADRN